MKEKIKRFRRILRVRELNRNMIQKKLAELKQREQKVLDRLRELRDQKAGYLDTFNNISAKSVNIDVIRRASEDIMRIEEGIKRGIVEVLKLKQVIKRADSELIESHKEVKKIELHLEKLGIELDLNLKLEEQKVVDDMAAISYSRKKGRSI